MSKKIYIVSLNSVVTGGPESLHQLASEIQKLGFETYIYYIDTKTTYIPEKFRKYKVPVCTEIEDNEDNLIITPEVHTEIFYNLKKIKKVIWWLSLDYYLDQFPTRYTKRFSERKNIPVLFSYIILYTLRKYKKNIFNFKEDEADIYHLYNCEYINNYLNEKKIPNSKKKYLCGPLSDEFFESEIDMNNKENIIIYNPKKDNKFIYKIKKYAQNNSLDMEFIPIENMKSSECIELMKKAKVYIDFGYFPGPERLPREAVMNYCNIVTGLEGSSRNNLDVPIPEKFKFEKKDSNIPNICLTLLELTENYVNNFSNFDVYRNKVIHQKDNFSMDIEEFINSLK
ncbi:hypothetical protein DFR54_10547 [Vagococcus fluvialis]|uniref:Glycosyltransferase involved in cell wall biosynthesis n=1 Tax=Vagococcus fluvialis TaxID=2738 RepID=A0A369AW70_9ENTE|nr:hypothetical protein [Vagococcus fluvialis]MBO0419508.1 hypothetical protein [Vagococcus fluvialis]RCX13640.1 hypothetical protein DFR54_10547 [Vagococcus fluvialis]RSU02224.1 hypothetical protein CBF32_06460 [Vagococcus fluvialis]